MSHAFESIWNINSNPVSNIHAINAIKIIMSNLPDLINDLENIQLREQIMKASMYAGLAFWDKTLLTSHSIYPITLKYKIHTELLAHLRCPLYLNQFRD